MRQDRSEAMASAVTVSLPPALLRLFPEATSRVELRASTVRDALDVLNTRWPGMRDRLRDSAPAIRPHIAVFVNGCRAELGTTLSDGDDVFIITRISGG